MFYEAYQVRVTAWLHACFGGPSGIDPGAMDPIVRVHRFLEEALELAQAGACTADEARQLVDYVFGRPIGELRQEVGGTLVTLAALCQAHGVDMDACGKVELDRVWANIDNIRQKSRSKPKWRSPLPVAPADPEIAAIHTATEGTMT